MTVHPKSTSRRRSNPKRVIFPVFAAILIVALILLIFEIALSLLLPIQTVGISKAYMYDDQLGYRLKPGSHSQLTDYLQEIQVNDLGTVNYNEDFSNYGRLVFALGDSYTQGTGNPPDVAYPFQLDLQLNQDHEGNYHRRYGVVNLGLAAYGGRQSLLVLERYSEQIGVPALVLYLGSENDNIDDRLFEDGYRHEHLVEGNPRRRWLQFSEQIFGSSQLFQRVKLVLSRLRRSNALKIDNKTEVNDQRSVAELQWPVIQDIFEICRGYEARLIVSWASGDESYRWLKQQAEAEGIGFADWYPRAELVRLNMPGLVMEHTHSGGHYRAWVNRIIAEEFARQILIIEDVAIDSFGR